VAIKHLSTSFTAVIVSRPPGIAKQALSDKRDRFHGNLLCVRTYLTCYVSVKDVD